MNKTPRMLTYVANWKMNQSFAQVVQFCTAHAQHYKDLVQKTDALVVLCPPFESILAARSIFDNSEIYIGAQNCSEYKLGPYTGEVSAQSLKEIGCSLCIIGHSERRRLFGETNEMVANKLQQLIKQELPSVVCIGETEQEYKENKTKEVLSAQLTPIFEVINKNKPHGMYCAYEPVWSIGTGNVPDPEYLATIFAWLVQHVRKNAPGIPLGFLYGGSVTEENCATIAAIDGIGGFLIGGASLDFQKFEKIVSLTS